MIQALPGFRDFYPADAAARRYVFEKWREVARRYGFVEVDGPTLESVELYKKKSGGELVGQLFNFVDKGEREVALRPEMTPTLARMVAARDRDFKKPLKWFSVASFFRYEKQQKGRLREFTQLNCDLIGEASAAADAEMIALAIDLFRSFGLTADDFFIRVNDRNVWLEFLAGRGVPGGTRPGVFCRSSTRSSASGPRSARKSWRRLTSRARNWMRFWPGPRRNSAARSARWKRICRRAGWGRS